MPMQEAEDRTREKEKSVQSEEAQIKEISNGSFGSKEDEELSYCPSTDEEDSEHYHIQMKWQRKRKVTEKKRTSRFQEDQK